VYQSKRVLAVIPARGGSKGIPLKNIVPVNGKPLIRYTLETASCIDWIDMIAVSTDHEQIMTEVKLFADVECVARPEHLSGDRIGDMPVLLHALSKCEEIEGKKFDVVLMLQPTSPLRSPDQIESCTKKLIDGLWESVWTVSETDLKFHPLKQLVISTDEELSFFHSEGSAIIARQQLQKTHFRNGICYAFTRSSIISSNSVWIEGKTSFVVTSEPFANIDSYGDLQLAEQLLTQASFTRKSK
jgi:CMP-N-acetylneuraminic acid synthetase